MVGEEHIVFSYGLTYLELQVDPRLSEECASTSRTCSSERRVFAGIILLFDRGSEEIVKSYFASLIEFATWPGMAGVISP